MSKKFLKWIGITLLLLVHIGVLFGVTRCGATLYKNITNGWAMRALAKETIPNYAFVTHDDLRIEETDQYGRYLYSVDHGQDDAKKAFIIVQKVDRETHTIYYYKDKSTLLVDDLSNLTEWEQDQIEILKEQNDWGLPLQDTKMTCIVVE